MIKTILMILAKILIFEICFFDFAFLSIYPLIILRTKLKIIISKKIEVIVINNFDHPGTILNIGDRLAILRKAGICLKIFPFS